MVKLGHLLASVPAVVAAAPWLTQEPERYPALGEVVEGLSTNSHACSPGTLFIGMPGTRVDGGEFWSGALSGGAIAAVVSESALQKFPAQNGECVIAVPDLVKVCADIAAAFYQHPAQTLQLTGVTGTNGKTTTSHLIEYFLNQQQRPSALLGTLYTRWPGYQKNATHTTPFATDLQKQLAEALQAGNQYAVMEVSSHALAQGRVLQCDFACAVFTNLTQDHLDFHGTMDNYFAAKALLFEGQYLKGRAVINQDDVYGQKLIDRLPSEQVYTYSVNGSTADFYTKDLDYQPTGVQGILVTPQGSLPFQSPLVGQFNLANVLAAIASGVHFGLDLATMVKDLLNFPGVPGRMEQVKIRPDQDISVMVDYAHTPDSLENALKAARPFIPGRLICVFGCGGDRDRTKRPLMGNIAAQLSDLAVVTSDNPRTEDPEQILADVVQGIAPDAKPWIIGDRATAIQKAIREAQPGDGVLIAGKGHEDYQILGTEKIHFDDREQAREALTLRYNGHH
ncbi:MULTISPECIES: UDP-N-acetylmuramoyl-L-alanyl-D-glutamate--2,6-diaminopimelate ligase [unclassified Synechocystis]|uniref:UDP-N-acetylmuramoyl-L-alanyl-D-glutamate--2, 6-diaminopimelate ligase n=1 Tax=unclassified Synechocystis TaxID=2640012 RepID=UPI000491A1BA|nr:MULTISPECIES: UDP-N-acetylmuramoyl-L-alanyl-D-glutamate--2,6-diaminopimelate ligase [unclassified Synechocystis]AIE72909.1 UDP-N-acetylmuramoylalanyl-D-glutamate--2,6- diaminopimelate ligase [Synechocystis sp. PCC 6714]MCT0252608.1 UDP-N-acetylmuramoyl-L-alanyl-D-glutamate--2,6-diaminopimelate ligase [Synechocystis sp. CS-94]